MGTLALINLPAFLEGLKEENPGWKTSVAPRRQQQQFKVEAYGTWRKNASRAPKERGLEPPLSTMDRARRQGRGHGGMKRGDRQAGGQAGRERGLPAPQTPETASPSPPGPPAAGREGQHAWWDVFLCCMRLSPALCCCIFHNLSCPLKKGNVKLVAGFLSVVFFLFVCFYCCISQNLAVLQRRRRRRREEETWMQVKHENKEEK